jgi:hypothetical protein
VAGSEKSPERDSEIPILIGLATGVLLFACVPDEQAASRSVATIVAMRLSRPSGLAVASTVTPYAVDCTGLNDNQQLDEKLMKIGESWAPRGTYAAGRCRDA